MAMTSALRRLARNRASLLAKACAKQDVCPVTSQGGNFRAVSSFSSLPVQSTRVYRSLFPSTRTLTISRDFSGFEILPTIVYGCFKYLGWTGERTQSNIKILSSKPTHAYQPRTDEVKTISQKIKKFQDQYLEDRVLTVYIKGERGTGKTQLLREFGETYNSNPTRLLRRKIVATIDTKSLSRFYRSYLRLGLDLKCPMNGELDRIVTEVQSALQNYPDWMLIVEGMSLNKEGHTEYGQFLPQPGSQQWGRGVVLVTTSDDHVIPHDNPCAGVFEMPPMTEEDTIELLMKISGCHDKEGAKELVNSKLIERTPIEVVSVATSIKDVRTHSDTEDFSFKDYQPLPTMLSDQDTTSIVQTAKQLAQSDPTLAKVFRLLAFCPHEPLPMTVVERFLGVHADLDTVRKCELLGRNSPEEPEDDYDKMERVFLPPATHMSFVRAFANGDTTSSVHDPEVEKIVDCILEEHKNASHSHATTSMWIKQMLFPHIKKCWKTCTYLPRYQRLQLCVALSYSYIDISKNPEKAKGVLQELIADFKDKRNLTLKDITPCERAKIYLALGTTYRHLGDYEKSTENLKAALGERKHLESLDVADIQKEFSATLFCCGEYMESREHLQLALELYQETFGIEHHLVVETLSNLAYICVKEGRWRKAEDYLKETESQLEKLQCSKYLALVTQENLATLYSELGNHDKVINMMETEVQGWNDYHAAQAVPLANLTAAYYRNGDWTKSEETFQKLETLMEEQVDIPLAALQVLGTTFCEFGDIQMAERLCRMMKNVKAEGAQLLLGKVYRLIGNWNKAQRTLEATLRRSEAVYGADHIRVGRVLGDLGKVYQDQGLLTRSVATFERAHNILVKFFGTHPHPEVAFVLSDLGRAAQRTGDDKKQGTARMENALNIWNMSIENPVFKSEKTSVHAMYSQMLSNYGILLRDTERFDEAESVLTEALDLQDRILAKNSLLRLKTIYRLGTVWDRQGKHKEAKEKIESALNSLTDICPDHPFTAVMLTGAARSMKNDTEATLGHLDKALEIRTKPDRHCLDIHTLIARCYRVRGETLQMQDPPRALRSFVQAIEVLGKLIERERTEQFRVSSDSSIEVAVVNKWEQRQESNRNMLENIIADMAKNK